MGKRSFFIKALKAGKYKKLEWIISVLALIKQNPDAIQLNQEDPNNHYKLFSDLSGYSYYNPETKQIEKIFDGIVGQPLINPKDKLLISPDDIPNLKEDIETTYGRLLFNWICLVKPFGTKIPYMNEYVKLDKIEEIIVSKLTDNPENIEDRSQDKIYVDEYLEYTKSAFFLTGLSQVSTQGATEKLLLPPPGLKEFKNKLLEENKDKLDDMATVAKIDKQLVEFDSEYIKDDPGEDFLISGKSRSTVRKKVFLMLGAEPGLDDNTVNAKLITNSLNEGWDVSKLADMNNSLRAGSFNRGAQTELGGVAVKWLLRASSNINITEEDCGSKLGSPVLIDENNVNTLIGFSIIVSNKTYKINSIDEAKQYIGKLVMLRNPMYCTLDKTDYCKTCCGDKLSSNPTGASIAVAAYGSVFLSIFMSAAHSRQLELAHMDLKTSII